MNLAATPPTEHAGNFIGRDGVQFCPNTAKVKVFISANKEMCVLQCTNKPGVGLVVWVVARDPRVLSSSLVGR